MKAYYAALILLVVAGCSSDKPLDMPVQGNLSPQAKSLAEKSISKIKSVCPGLNKYGNVLVYKGIEDNSSYANWITIKFDVPDVKSDIPSDYRALGHSCFMDVDLKGETVSIAKNPCKAVCLDQVVDGTMYDNGSNLVLKLN